MRKRVMAIAVVMVLLTGCVATPRYAVNTRGMSPYDAAVAECTQYAQSRVDQGASIGTSAAVGAVIGGLLGAITGNRHDAAGLAAAGAIVGAGAGAAVSSDAQQQIVNDCMAQRGF